MSDVVLGIGCSHSSFMNTHADVASDQGAVARFRAGLGLARQAIEGARPDAIVIVGSNHFRGMWLDLLPPFTLGIGACWATGEAGTPAGPIPIDVDLGRALYAHLVADDFDPAFSLTLQVDHGVSLPLQYLTPALEVPIVPIIVNVFARPLPKLSRCVAFGAALGRAIAEDGLDRRIVVVASGGLSHHIPFPDWTSPDGDDEEYLVEAFTNGRTNWPEYEVRRRAISSGTTAEIRPEFDAELLGLFEAGRLNEVAQLSDEDLELAGGNGAHEMRTWLVMVGAAGPGKGRRLAYEPIEEWLTGMAVALYEPERQLSLDLVD